MSDRAVLAIVDALVSHISRWRAHSSALNHLHKREAVSLSISDRGQSEAGSA